MSGHSGGVVVAERKIILWPSAVGRKGVHVRPSIRLFHTGSQGKNWKQRKLAKAKITFFQGKD